MKHWLRGGVLLAALSSACLQAGDLESLHAFNVNYGLQPGWTLQLHTRLRTFENIGAYNQLRAGPVVIWQPVRRVSWMNGYYLADQNTRVVHQRYRIHRAWSAAQYRLIQGEKWSLDARGGLERMFSTRFDDYWRVRGRAILSRATPIGQVYATTEGIRDQRIWYGRWTGGMTWRLGKNVSFGAGYEYRDAARGPGSHIIATVLQWETHRNTPDHVD